LIPKKVEPVLSTTGRFGNPVFVWDGVLDSDGDCDED